MISRESIMELSERIAQHFAPQRIILFGSYAYGSPSEGSDVDLLVILPFEGASVTKAIEILRRVQPRIPVDLVVRTPEDLRQRLEWNDFFLREIVEKGEVLYESIDG